MGIVLEEKDVRLDEIEYTDSIFDTDDKTMSLIQDSIGRIDMFTPILIYPTTQYKNKKYAIAEGRCRYETYEKQGKVSIRSFIIDPSYSKIVEIDAEVCRRRSPDTAIKEALKFREEYYKEIHEIEDKKHNKQAEEHKMSDSEVAKLKVKYEKEKDELQTQFQTEKDELLEQIDSFKAQTKERFEKEVEKKVKEKLKTEKDEYDELSAKDKKKYEESIRKDINKELNSKYDKTIKEKENALEISKNNYLNQQKIIDAHLDELGKSKRLAKEHSELATKYKNDHEIAIKRLESAVGVDMVIDRLRVAKGDIERTNKVINEHKDVFMPHKESIIQLVSEIESVLDRTKVLLKK